MRKVRTEQEWKAIENEIASLREQRKEISKQIGELNRIMLNRKNHLRYYGEYKDMTKTKAYQMFGKRLKDLSPEELKEYNRRSVAERRKQLLAKRKGENK